MKNLKPPPQKKKKEEKIKKRFQKENRPTNYGATKENQQSHNKKKEEKGEKKKITTHILTTKGWLTLRRMLFSFWTCCTCFSRMTSAMAKIFSAQYSRVLFSRHSTTRPNVPVPIFNQKDNNNKQLHHAITLSMF